MKLLSNSILFALGLCFTINAQAESLMRDYYYVVSDVESDTVKQGRCIVKGRVIDPDTEQGIKGGIVANLTKTSYAITDDSGYYQINIPATDTTIFFFHKKYEEIVCWNYPFKSGHVVTMNFVSSEKLPDGIMRVEEKPVIYLYPDQTMNISIKLDEAIELTHVYPEYNNQWNVVAHTDGSIEVNGRTYPYLFWEGKTDNIGLPVSYLGYHGTAVKTDTVISYLENQLAMFGFNSKESTDFITYWGPRLQKKDYAVVNFYVDDIYNKMIGGITIEPKPDVIRRVYMVFQGFDQLPSVVNTGYHNLEPLKREGFVVMEWGGTDLNLTANP